jgi:hypothetical protein
MKLERPQFSNANRQDEGAEYYSERLNEFNARLSDTQKALYLSIIALLRVFRISAPHSAIRRPRKLRSNFAQLLNECGFEQEFRTKERFVWFRVQKKP